RAARPPAEVRAAANLVERLTATQPDAPAPAVHRRRGRLAPADVDQLLARPALATWLAPERPERLARHAEHMALWCALAGRPSDAGLWTTLARAARRAPGEDPLTRALAARTAPAPAAAFPTDPALRQRLRARFAAGLSVPTATDLARLDFAEAAALALGLDDDGLGLAWALGKAYANHHLTASGGGAARGAVAARRLARHAADLLGPDRAERA